MNGAVAGSFPHLCRTGAICLILAAAGCRTAPRLTGAPVPGIVAAPEVGGPSAVFPASSEVDVTHADAPGSSVPGDGAAGDEASRGTLVLSLEGALALGLGTNLELRLGRLGPLIRAEDFFIEGEVFEPVVYGEVARSDAESQTANTQLGADVLTEDNRIAAAGVRKTWPLGTRTDLRWAYDRRASNSEFRTLNPGHASVLGLNIVQPLLEGFGVDVNRAALEKAVNDRKIAEEEFEILLEAELLNVYRAYWLLVAASANLDIQEESLRLADEQVAVVRDQLDAGAAAPLELVSAEAAYARQQESVITAQNAYRKAGDILIERIRPSSDLADYAVRIIPSTQPALGDSESVSPPSAAACFATALGNRPELRVDELRIASADIELLTTRNRRRPTVNLVGRYGFSGLEGTRDDSFSTVAEGAFPEWRIGATLEYFFDGEARRARARQAALELESAETRYEKTASSIAVEVRAALFDLETAVQRLAATRRTLGLAREQYEGERDRLSVGRSTVFQVDSFRRDLLDAERNNLRAEIDLYLARALLAAAQGRFAATVLEGVGPVAGDDR